MREIPQKYDHLEAEQRWRQRWEDWGIYRWDPTVPRERTFVVDTPPPTVSGSLHVGHVFSYTHQDLLVRYQRMIGKNIAYPMGWDDNGLPTERRVQNYLGIRCNPHLAVRFRVGSQRWVGVARVRSRRFPGRTLSRRVRW